MRHDLSLSPCKLLWHSCIQTKVFERPPFHDKATTMSTEDLSPPASFTTVLLPADKTIDAADGTEVRLLTGVAGGGMAHFRLPSGRIAHAVIHRTVEEIWYVLSGKGRIWRKLGTHEEVTELVPGTAITLPAGTHFQFRNDGTHDLDVLGITMPPWPGADEAVMIDGPWTPSA